jgi:hypothetical protein
MSQDQENRSDIEFREVPMIQTVKAVIDATGRIRLLGEVQVDAPRRALVIVLDEPTVGRLNCQAVGVGPLFPGASRRCHSREIEMIRRSIQLPVVRSAWRYIRPTV